VDIPKTRDFEGRAVISDAKEAFLGGHLRAACMMQGAFYPALGLQTA
jgi:hypothetical protein